MAATEVKNGQCDWLIDWSFLYSAIFDSGQTHCTLVVCESESMTVALLSAILNIPSKWCTFSAVCLLHGWCHLKLLPSRPTFSVRHTIMHEFSFIRSYIRRLHVWLAVTRQLHLWQNDLVLACYSAVTRGKWYRNKSQQQKVDPGEEYSPATPAGTRTRDPPAAPITSRGRRSATEATSAPRSW